MEIEVVYSFVILFNIFMWMLATHTYTFGHFLEQAIFINRRLLHRLSTSRVKSVSKSVEDILLRDDENINGFNPPRTLRLAIAICITIENILIAVIPWNDEAISAHSMASQAGRLCYMNLVPLCLLAIPGDSIISTFIKQCREQWLWAHSFFGWLITCQGAIHVIASLCLVTSTPGPATSSWITGSTAGVLLISVALSSKLQQKADYSFSNVLSRFFHSYKNPTGISWLSTHWILSSILCLLIVAHVILHLSWAFVLAVTASIVALAGTCLTQSTNSMSHSFTEFESSTRDSPHVGVLEIQIPVSMTAGQSCYFKVDGIPIRVAWIRRSLDDISKTQKYIAVLFVSVNEKAPNKLEVCGPYTIPLTPSIITDKTLDIVAMDSGVVEAYQSLAWRYALTGREKGTTLTWFNENPAMLEAWFTYAGFNERLCIRIVCYGRSYKFLHNSPAVRGAYEKKIGKEDRKDEDKFIYKVADAIDSRFIQFSIDENERIEDILQDLVPISKNLYAVGENLRSYGIRPMRLDFDNKEDKRHGSFRV